MKVDLELLTKLEKLSYLNIADEKREEVVEQLSEILEYVENLKELDTTELESYFSTLTGGTPLREDQPVSSKEISQTVLAHAPQAEDDFFIVPAIIE